MSNFNNNNNENEDEIKEEIDYNYNDFENDENILKNIESTYDKFLLESCVIEGKKQNEYHNLLKNQMKNIINNIKEKNIFDIEFNTQNKKINRIIENSYINENKFFKQ